MTFFKRRVQCNCEFVLPAEDVAYGRTWMVDRVRYLLEMQLKTTSFLEVLRHATPCFLRGGKINKHPRVETSTGHTTHRNGDSGYLESPILSPPSHS